MLVDVFFNRAPQTLMKRVNSLSRITNYLISYGRTFPCSESDVYQYFKKESSIGAPASRLKAVFEALVFARHVLGVKALEDVIDSRRCLGAASTSVFANLRQASPFKVKQLQKLHSILSSEADPWNRVMAGMILFCTYARSRWSDAQHAEDLFWDMDNDGNWSSFEIKTTVHKTARALHLRHMFLPISASAVGVTKDNWCEQWIHVRQLLGISNLKNFPLMPAPGPDLSPTKRALTTGEAKKWLHHLLGPDLIGESDRLTTHSCKATCLSFMAKRGVNLEDRLVLGYHSNKLRVGLTYSRDGAARPLALLAHVLKEIQDGIFEPDNTRSGRLKPNATSLDQLNVLSLGSEHIVAPDPALGKSPPKTGNEPDEATGDGEASHATTETSETEDEQSFVSPVVGHFNVSIPEDKSMWLNRATKMFHLSERHHKRILLCGRQVTTNVVAHSGRIRFDSAKCKQCFRQLRAESSGSKP